MKHQRQQIERKKGTCTQEQIISWKGSSNRGVIKSAKQRKCRTRQ